MFVEYKRSDAAPLPLANEIVGGFRIGLVANEETGMWTVTESPV